MAKFLKKVSKLLTGTDMDGKVKNNGEIRGKEAKIRDGDDRHEGNGIGERKMRTKDPPDELKNRGKLFVGGLNYQTTSKGLETYFSQFGNVLDAIVMRFPDSGKSRGFGFVLFVEVSDAESALRSNPHVLDGKTIDVRPFVSSENASNTTKKETAFKVFLGGLPDYVSADVLKQFFERYGEISRIVIPQDKNTKKSKGFGFIWFKSEEAVEKCLSEGFVHLWGRRIHIKKAGPHSSSHVSDATDAVAEMGPACLQVEDYSLEDLLLWDRKSTSSAVDNETSSTASGERSEKDFKLQNAVEVFLSPKSENFDAMSKGKAAEEEVNFEKLLREFLVSCNKKYSASNENLISFSDSDSEESDNGTHSDCESGDVSENNYGADSENDTSAIGQLSTEFLGMLRGDSLVRSEEVLDLSNAYSRDCRDIQTSVPFNFRENNGSLFCPLCQWAPEDNSCESFLIHCKTVSHRMKLKERFPRERVQVIEQSKRNKQIEKGNSQVKPCPQKPLAMVQKGTSKIRDKIHTQGKREKQNEKERSQKELNTKDVVRGGKKSGNVEIKNTPSNSKPKENKNENDEAKSTKRLKMMALAKGMSCIQPMSNEHLKCNMCNKIIPKAPDFNVVMKNVSSHLQSKVHLKKMLETENLLKESLEKKQEKAESCNNAKNPPNQKTQGKASSQEQKNPNEKTQSKPSSQEQKNPNEKTQSKPSSQEQKNPNEKTQSKPSSQEQKNPNQKTQSKPSSQEQKNPNEKTQSKPSSQEQKNPNQKTQNKPSSQEQEIPSQGNVAKDSGSKKSQGKSSDSKSLFLCIPCNYFNKNIEIFKSHLKSESHLDCFISRGVSTDLSLDNLSNCKSCNLFLYGSLYYINKHYSKCLKKKE